MSRVKRGVTNHARHKKVLKAAEGYYGRRKSTIRIAMQAVEKAGQYAYRDRRQRKRHQASADGSTNQQFGRALLRSRGTIGHRPPKRRWRRPNAATASLSVSASKSGHRVSTNSSSA